MTKMRTNCIFSLIENIFGNIFVYQQTMRTQSFLAKDSFHYDEERGLDKSVLTRKTSFTLSGLIKT
jgi:hypothetical protein